MCVDNDSYPPIPPIAGGSVGGKDFRLSSSDGKFIAYAARAAKPTGAGMIVIPDVRGLHPYYKALADRFAEIGVASVAFDFFARTAPSDDRSDAFQYMENVGMTKPETIQADINACAAYLRGKDGGAVRSLFSVGFCFGGAISYLQATTGLGYAGVIGFYGWPLGLRWLKEPLWPAPIDTAAQYKCPVLSIYGDADDGIPGADRKAFAEALKKASVKPEEHVYPGAPHSFFDRKYEEFKDASADAWTRVQGFLKANAK